MDGFAPPEKDQELKLAHQLLGSRSIDLQVLEGLLGAPARFKDLKRFVKGSSDTPLTRALRRLGDAGLIRQGLTLDAPGDPRYYAATRYGVHVALKAHEMRPVAEVLAEVKAAGLLAA